MRMYVRGICNCQTSESEGRYVCILGKKIIYGDVLGTTTNRMILTGIIEGIRALSEPTELEVFTHGYFGMNKMYKENAVNKDLLELLKVELMKGRHKVKFTYGQEKQQELINLCRTLKHKEVNPLIKKDEQLSLF